MFGRLVASLVNQAVEVVAPAAKSPLEALNIHFSHIRQYYQELADYSDAATKINQLVNNIPYHMQSIIVIIQQEQLDQQEDAEMTGVVLESIIQQRILAQLVQWAIADKPKGMLMETTRFFTELIKAVHHRLLPEGQVRQPLEHLVRQLKSTCDPLALTPLNAEFMLLLLTIFEQINQNPALLNLFIESDQIPLFEYAVGYTGAGDISTAETAQKIVILALQSIARCQPQLIAKSSLAAMLSERLVVSFSRCSEPVASSHAYQILINYWLFVNDLISIAEVAGADLAKLGSTLMPKEFLCNSLILNFFDKFLYLNIDLDDVNQDTAIRLELFSNMLKLVKDSAFRYGIIDSLLKKRENDGESGSILNSLSKSLASDSEQISLAAFKVFDSLIGTYYHRIFELLVLSHIPEDLDTVKSAENAAFIGKLLEISSAVLGLTDKILPGSKLENYFADAQECNEDCFFSFKAWPPVSGVSSPQVVIDILEIVLVQFDHFFSNSIRKNLAIVSLLSKIAHLPHPGLQAFLLRGVNNTTQGAQLGYSICLFLRICMISKSIQDIYEATPDLKEKVGLIRSHCKDDIMSMIHLVGRAPLSVGMKELTQLLAGRSELAVKQDDKSNPVMFSNFLPQVLILSEFCKEMAVILFLVHKTLEIDGRSSC